MALTKEKNAQIAAMNAKGMCIEAIAKKAGLKKDDVRDSLESRGRSYIEMGLMTSQEKEDWIREMQADGKSIPDIMELTGLGKSTVYTYIFYKGKGKTENKTEDKPEEKPDLITPQKKEGKVYANHTIKEKETVIKLYKEGKKLGQIAIKTGIAKSTVANWIRNYKKEHLEEKAAEPTKAGQINEEFDKAVDEMVEESKGKEEEKQAYKEAVIEVESQPIKTENEKRMEAAEQSLDRIKNDELSIKLPLVVGERVDISEKRERLLDICETALKAAESGMLGIYSQLSDAEKRAWDLGEIFGELMRARGEFV